MAHDISPEQLSQRIIDAALVDSRVMDSVWAELGTREVRLDDLTSILLRKELLTNFQLDRLFKGEKGGYFYGDYKVLYLVGNGTFARVYRAVNEKTGRIVAIKALRKRFRDDKSMTEQFIREGKIGMLLRHPNIVPIYEADPLPTPHLVMEFVEGRNLREFLRVRKKLDPVEAMRLIVDVLAGLASAAERGHTHRDLKMSNVLITSRGAAKLVDFGLAGIQIGAGTPGDDASNPRTIDYAGLERASGVRNNDPRSDLYFAGVILYHMLAGVSPIGEARDRLSRLSVARYQNIKPITVHDANLPSRLVAFVMRALELNPEKRYASAKEMYEDAKRLLARLQAGDAGDADSPDPEPAPEPVVSAPASPDQEGSGRTVLVVESKIEMQDLLRDRLKKYGYRVLIYSEPQRAFNRLLESEVKLCDCLIFGTSELGEVAVRGFNEFGSHEGTKDLPAILFADNRHAELVKEAQLAEHRVLVSMPLKMRELRDTLSRLLRLPVGQVSNVS